MQDVILIFFITLLSAFIFGELFTKLKLPKIIGQIIAGLILGTPLLAGFFDLGSQGVVALLSQIGIIFLLILTGLEIDLRILKKVRWM